MSKTSLQLLQKNQKKLSVIDTASFGAPRASYNNVVAPNKFNYVPKGENDPGPGDYAVSYKETGKSKQHKYTFRGSRKDLFDVKRYPGPGSYDTPSPR